MSNYPTITQTLEKLKNLKNIKTFEDAITSISYWKRHLILCTIDEEVGESMESIIRFWNAYDEENDIPIEDREPIIVYIDSPGGSLTATFTIIDAIRMSKTPVWTVNIGTAYSGGFFTYITGHRRFTYPHASFLYHEGSTEIGGDAGKFQNYAAFYKHQLEELKEIVLNHTNISEETYKEKRRDDWWIDANEAIELGIADEIVDKFVI